MKTFNPSNFLPEKVVACSVVNGVLTSRLENVSPPPDKRVSFLMYDLPHCIKRGDLNPVSTKILDADSVDKEIAVSDLRDILNNPVNINENADK